MNSLRPSRRPTPPLVRLRLLGFGVLSLFIAATVFLFPSAFPSVLQRIGGPIWEGSNIAGGAFQTLGESFRSKYDLIQENRALQQKLADIELQLQGLKIIQEENFELASRKDHEESSPKIVAAVLTRPNVSLYDTLIVDAGERDGIETGARAYAGSDVLIGEVAAVYRTTALIKLFSTPGERTIVQVGTGKIQAEAIGKGAGNFEARLPHGANIVEGDDVVIPGIHPKIFGTVLSIIAGPADPFETILFRGPINPFEIRHVFIGE
ncbi:hypothetical protein A2671_00370 [Candidatus Kaiserbacteria bacterium RIFCSPHIGHO2_01_FULL_49_13]|uniref:Cell shape-determining protein MreC n=1 Tax=Candidatus Kaiserbacteria bacterium RIFCSPHIGHO2_01_FULL_49_13 TaxID=1798477 RepID=A0A1F6CCS3_9BACT|nr:MAG: hypothetical protein A2671_00370 [Candidatus Kaiserbacteria bacterium RIFCSPHIGHO2_01_FULL_49_13]